MKFGFTKLFAGLSIVVGLYFSMCAGPIHASVPAPGTQRPAFKAGELIVYAQPGTPQADIDALAAKVSASQVVPLLLADCYQFILPAENANDHDTLAAVSALTTDPRVRWVSANPYSYTLQAAPSGPTAIPNDPLYATRQWDMRLINMPQAWAIEKGQPDVNVCVIDSGGDHNHEDLQGVFLMPGSFDFGNNQAEFIPDGPGPSLQHGTHVSGIVAAKADNGKGIAGVCWQNTKILFLKVHKKGDPEASINGAALINAYQYLIANAAQYHIVALNMSYGGPGDPNNLSDPRNVSLKQLAAQGIILVAAAGNDNADNHNDLPCGMAEVISVAAVGPSGLKSSFSSFGKIEIAAPGGEFTANGDPDEITSTLDGAYGVESGTSQASPHVAGVFGLLRAVPGVSAELARAAMFDTARRTGLPLSLPLPDARYGYGLVDAAAALQRVSIRAVVAEPAGRDKSGNSTDPTGVNAPIETFKPVLRFKVNNVPLDSLGITVDGKAVPADQLKASVESGNPSAANPSYTIAIRYQLPVGDGGEHVATVQYNNPPPGVVAQDTRRFVVTPHHFNAGTSFISIPYAEPAADSPTGSFRDGTQLLGGGTTLYRWIQAQGSYAAAGPAAAQQSPLASFLPADQVPTTDPKAADTRPIGLGYFIKSPTTITVNTNGANYPKTPFRIPLHEGWNMIGDPYNYTVPFNTTLIDRGTGDRIPVQQAVDQKLLLPQIYRLVNGSYDFATLPNGALMPWEGHWIYVIPRDPAHPSTANVMSLIVTPTPVGGSAGTKSPSVPAPGAGWRMRLVARSGDLIDGATTIGVDPAATDGSNRSRAPKPPVMSPYVSLSSVREDGPARNYIQDLRPNGQNQTWKLEVTSDRPAGQVSLTWPDIRSMPRGTAAVLHDKSTGSAIDMRRQNAYTFAAGDAGTTRAFELIVSPAAARGRALLSNVTVTGGTGRGAGLFDVRYTLSREATMTATISTFGGHPITAILPGRAAPTGDSHFTWAGRDNKGAALPAGAYVLELRAVTNDGEVTREVRPVVITGR